MASSLNPHVVVLAGGMEDVDSLARLVNLLPKSPRILVIISVHGFADDKQQSLLHKRLNASNSLTVMPAIDGQVVHAGCVYVASSSNRVVFKTADSLGVVPQAIALENHALTASDQLFKSAAHFHGGRVIGIVLSGRGKDGTKGLLAITEVHGQRIVQSPSESKYPEMPTNALLGDHVQHSLTLDELGVFLSKINDS